MFVIVWKWIVCCLVGISSCACTNWWESSILAQVRNL